MFFDAVAKYLAVSNNSETHYAQDYYEFILSGKLILESTDTAYLRIKENYLYFNLDLINSDYIKQILIFKDGTSLISYYTERNTVDYKIFDTIHELKPLFLESVFTQTYDYLYKLIDSQPNVSYKTKYLLDEISKNLNTYIHLELVVEWILQIPDNYKRLDDKLNLLLTEKDLNRLFKYQFQLINYNTINVDLSFLFYDTDHVFLTIKNGTVISPSSDYELISEEIQNYLLEIIRSHADNNYTQFLIELKNNPRFHQKAINNNSFDCIFIDFIVYNTDFYGSDIYKKDIVQSIFYIEHFHIMQMYLGQLIVQNEIYFPYIYNCDYSSIFIGGLYSDNFSNITEETYLPPISVNLSVIYLAIHYHFYFNIDSTVFIRNIEILLSNHPVTISKKILRALFEKEDKIKFLCLLLKSKIFSSCITKEGLIFINNTLSEYGVDVLQEYPDIYKNIGPFHYLMVKLFYKEEK